MRGAADSFVLVLFSCGSVIAGCHYIPPVDPCEGVTCSGHGLCVSGAENALCECDLGYRAVDLECVAVASDGDGDGDADGGADGDADTDGEGDADSGSDAGEDGDADVEGDGDVEAEPRCGDGERQEGEECDDGAANSDIVADACRTDCRLPWCGDSVTDSGEGCDDGNGVDVDGCRADCTTCELVLEEGRGSGVGGESVGSLWTGDIDGDGWVDAVVAVREHTGSSLAVLLHDGVWWPVWPAYYPAAECLTGGPAAAGDIDGDGDLDVVMGCYGWDGLPWSYILQARNRGDGTFDPLPGAAAGIETLVVESIGFGHLDRDSALDALVGAPDAIMVLRGRATGYVDPIDEEIAMAGTALATADMDGDGDLEVVGVSETGAVVGVALGAGDGTFAEPVTTATGAGPVDLVVGDLDEDGAVDAVVANGTDGNVTVHLNDGAGGLGVGTARGVGGTPVAAVGGDVNLDGHLDVVVACTAPDRVVVLLGDGTGAFPGEVSAARSRAPVDVALGDLDGDLDPDVVLLSNEDVGVLEVDCH